MWCGQAATEFGLLEYGQVPAGNNRCGLLCGPLRLLAWENLIAGATCGDEADGSGWARCLHGDDVGVVPVAAPFLDASR